MNKESNKIIETRKAEVEVRNLAQIPQWWLMLPHEEKEVLHGIVRGIRLLKRSQSPQVANAAAKWERSITCFIKCRLMSGVAPARRVTVRVTSSPASLRNPRGASPSRG